MKIHETALPGVLLLEPKVHRDARGSFCETYSLRRYRELGVSLPFVQDNVSCSGPDVLRGLHFQRNHAQGKLIQVLAGRIFDVTVDVDPRSASFGRHIAIELSAANHRQLWIPPGYAHGFCVMDAPVICQYKCTTYYDPADEAGIAWDCPRLAIAWPLARPVLSVRDRRLPDLDTWLRAGKDTLA